MGGWALAIVSLAALFAAAVLLATAVIALGEWSYRRQRARWRREQDTRMGWEPGWDRHRHD